MKMILLNNRSALEFWERGLGRNTVPVDSDGIPPLTASVRQLAQSRILSALSSPVSVMVSDPAMRNRSQRYRCQTWCKPFPAGSIYHVPGTDVLVAAPWFCFMQMAGRLVFADALRLGLEICGMHSTLPLSVGFDYPYTISENDRRMGCVPRAPLTTANALREQLGAVLPADSESQALKASRYLLDRSRSPAESRMYALLCLPSRIGGYSIPRPRLNYDIALPPELQAISGKRFFTCDMYYPGEGASLGIEYDGAYHSEQRQQRADNLRELILDTRGVHIIRVDWGQLAHQDATDMLAHRIARQLGVKLGAAGPRTLKARGRLRAEVLNWHSDLYCSRHDRASVD